MNVRRLLKLAAHLRLPETADHFDLSEWFYTTTGRTGPIGERIHDCGTVACIAGHATALFSPTTEPMDIVYRARDVLDLTRDETNDLFTPDSDVHEYEKVTASIAADVVEHFANTGEIIWPEEVHHDDT